MVSRFISTLAGLALVVAVYSSTATAQERGRGGRFGMPPGAESLMLLGAEPVQKELNLTDDQKAQVQKIVDGMRTEMMETFSGLQDLSPEERREKMDELRVEMGKKVVEIQKKADALLKPEQIERLKQLSVQRRGVGALEDAAVATALKLTDQQKKKIADIREAGARAQRESFQAAGGGGGGGGGGDREAMRERMTKFRAEQDAKVAEVLTAEQRDQLEKMKGKKFDFPPGGGFGGFGGAGGAGGNAALQTTRGAAAMKSTTSCVNRCGKRPSPRTIS